MSDATTPAHTAASDDARHRDPLMDRVVAAFDSVATDDARIRCFRVPGRIEVLGKHTDYAGGRSLLCAIERGIRMAVRARADRRITIGDVLANDVVEGEISTTLRAPAGHWSVYPFTVARRIAADFPSLRNGADIRFASDLPVAAGMSSSSALVVATFLALDAVNDLAADPAYRRNLRTRDDIAGYLGAVENGLPFGDLAGGGGVGTFGGSEDHTAILCGRPDSLVQYSFAPVRFERAVPLPDGYIFALASSGIAAEKAGGALASYNALSRKTSALAELWRSISGRADANLGAALASSPDAAARLRSALGEGESDGGFSAEALSDRLEQFVRESEEIIPAAADALADSDLARFGELVDRSQAGAERYLHNQVPETIHLARTARELGAAAASAFGAGFGGSVWALVRAETSQAFISEWERTYRAHFPARDAAAFFLTRPADPAEEIETASAHMDRTMDASSKKG